jgi:hypothetical protein
MVFVDTLHANRCAANTAYSYNALIRMGETLCSVFYEDLNDFA